MRKLMRMAGFMTWTIWFAFSRGRFIVGSEEFKQKGSHQKDTQEPVHQGKVWGSVFPYKRTRKESRNGRTHCRGRVH